MPFGDVMGYFRRKRPAIKPRQNVAGANDSPLPEYDEKRMSMQLEHLVEVRRGLKQDNPAAVNSEIRRTRTGDPEMDALLADEARRRGLARSLGTRR